VQLVLHDPVGQQPDCPGLCDLSQAHKSSLACIEGLSRKFWGPKRPLVAMEQSTYFCELCIGGADSVQVGLCVHVQQHVARRLFRPHQLRMRTPHARPSCLRRLTARALAALRLAVDRPF
jgi:hypothetical protein